MSENNSDKQDEDTGKSQRPAGREISGSPSGQSNTSSDTTRGQRVVELLEYNDDEPNGWTIGREFFDEDVAQNSDEDQEDFVFEDYDDDLYYGDERDGDDEDEDMNGLEADYVMANHQISSDDETDEPDEDEEAARIIDYDTSLPASHQYLGENFEESHRRQVFIENSKINLPLINLRHVILLPGQKLPIITGDLPPKIQLYLNVCTKGHTIGFMSNSSVNIIGTTAEVRDFTRVDGNDLRIIVEGRQRFKLLSAPFETASLGEVQILPENSLGLPFPPISSMMRHYNLPDIPDELIVSKYPSWFVKQYLTKNVMKRILKQLEHWCGADQAKDPNDFSYWVAANLPIGDSDRIKALSFDCTEARLFWLLNLLEDSTCLLCSKCENLICFRRDVFSMSKTGPQCSYVNPSGFIHDTITVRNTVGLLETYDWSDEFSWFPGYQWRLAHCDQCQAHIGWAYKSPKSKPRRFYGLSRLNVRLGTSNHIRNELI